MRYETTRVLAVLTFVMYAYLMGLVMEGTVHERRLVGRIAEVELNVLSLSSLFRLVLYGVVRCLLYGHMMVGCQGYGALERIPTAMIDKWFGFGIVCLIRNMEVDLVLVLILKARVADVDYAALPEQELFLHDYAQEMVVLRPGNGAKVGQNARESRGEEGIQSEAQPAYRAGYATFRMSLTNAREE